MSNTWLVIANSTTAYIYHLEHTKSNILKDLPKMWQENHPIPLMKTFTHPESRMKGRELLSDRDGHYRAPDTSHGAYSEHHSAHENEKTKFAHEIAQFLERERANNHYQYLIICAEPKFYGLLKQACSPLVNALIAYSILKDYVSLKSEALQKIIESLQKAA